jgi:hypothetical protein
MALISRSPTFLGDEEWKTVPWSTGTSPKDFMHHLMDVLADIPALLARYDILTRSLSTGTMHPTDAATEQTLLWSLAGNLDLRLRQWKWQWVDTQSAVQEWEVSSPEDGQFPVFRFKDAETLQIIKPKVIVYSSLRLATAMCTYHAARLLLSSVNMHPTERVTPHQQYTFACNICRTMDYYLRNCPGLLINRMAFVLRVAFDYLPEGIERQYLRDTFQLVGARYSLKMWSSTIPEISVQKS